MALALALTGVAAPIPLRAQIADEARGSLIYSSGRGADGRALQFRLLTAGAQPLPANGFACVNCHGADGKGGREGSIVMADIRYATLTRPLGAAPPWNRARAAYTEATLARAITEGIDSSGQQLDASMPRWRLSEAELADLIGYLKRLGSPR